MRGTELLPAMSLPEASGGSAGIYLPESNFLLFLAIVEGDSEG
jgi:hypothetical protein